MHIPEKQTVKPLSCSHVKQEAKQTAKLNIIGSEFSC